MKKLLILLITLLTPFEIAYGEVMRNYGHPTVYKTIYFKAGEKDANKILYEFAMQEMLENNVAANNQPDNVLAYKVDLDDDGINEIIGVVFGREYVAGSTGYSLFILKKYGNKYRDLSLTAFWPWNDFIILKKKVKGFHVIEVHCPDGNTRYLKYNNKYYDYD